MATHFKLAGSRSVLGLSILICICCGYGWFSARSEATRVRDSNRAIAAEMSRIERLAAAEQQKATERNEAAESQVKELELRISELAMSVEGHARQIAAPDGSVRWVDPIGKKVWIDIGEADGVDPRTAFDVHTKPQTHGKPAKADAATIKGTIEVTRVLEKNLSEARILQEDVENPIRKGDLVFQTRPGVQ